MTGANTIRRKSKSGQAMVEFLVGLVGVLLLVVGMYQIVVIVDRDFDSLIGSREEVAEQLTGTGGSSGGASYGDASSYEVPGDFYGEFLGTIQYHDEYQDLLDLQADPIDGYEPVASDPMRDMIGSEGGSSIPVESGMLRRFLGSEIVIRNEVWMPSWDDLMY